MRTKVNSRAMSQTARLNDRARSNFVRTASHLPVASAIGEIFGSSDDFKTAFLQHSYRSDVVRCYPGENRPIYNKVDHP